MGDPEHFQECGGWCFYIQEFRGWSVGSSWVDRNTWSWCLSFPLSPTSCSDWVKIDLMASLDTTWIHCGCMNFNWCIHSCFSLLYGVLKGYFVVSWCFILEVNQIELKLNSLPCSAQFELQQAILSINTLSFCRVIGWSSICDDNQEVSLQQWSLWLSEIILYKKDWMKSKEVELIKWHGLGALQFYLICVQFMKLGCVNTTSQC